MPDNHVKPTPEEIDAQLKATLEQVEKEEKEETPPSVEAEETIEEEEVTEEKETEEEPEEEKETAKAEDEDEEEEKAPDAETRLKESTKEAQKNFQDRKAMDEALHEANNLPEPTEEELTVEYPEWEDMSLTEKKLAKENFENKRFRNAVQQAAEGRRTINEWNDKVDEFVENPKTLVYNPELEGKQDEFKAFAKDKANRNINMTRLTEAFLYQQSKTKPAPKKGKMFETGTGGETKKLAPKSDKLSPEESEKLMKSDYNKWKQMLKDGKLAEVAT